jgi:hypothetical protein
MKILLTLLLLSPLAFAEESHLSCKSKIYELEVELFISTDSKSWIVLPPSLVPDNIFSSGTKKKIAKPKFTEDKITGTILIDNLLLRERFVINRKTGSINFDAYRSSFAGTCEKKDMTPKQNKF